MIQIQIKLHQVIGILHHIMFKITFNFLVSKICEILILSVFILKLKFNVNF